jgi:hypothetical protein
MSVISFPMRRIRPPKKANLNWLEDVLRGRRVGQQGIPTLEDCNCTNRKIRGNTECFLCSKNQYLYLGGIGDTDE